MSAVKEPHFFALEIREENFDSEVRNELARGSEGLREFLAGGMREKRFGGIVSDWRDYLNLFAGATDETALGDASPCYLWAPSAPQRIAERIPGARIVVMLRDPTDRAYSQYLHGVGLGLVRWSFREHIRRNLRERSGRFSLYYPFLEFGLYAEQLARYLNQFGSNVRVGFYEDFKKDPLTVYRNICRFLGVAEDFVPRMEHVHLQARVPKMPVIGHVMRSPMWRHAAKALPSSVRPLLRRTLIRKPGSNVIDPADRQYMLDYYREDTRRLGNLMSRNPAVMPSSEFPAWLHGG